MSKLNTSKYSLRSNNKLVGDCHPDERISITVKLKAGEPEGTYHDVMDYLTAYNVGASVADSNWHTVHAMGRAADLEKAFKIKLQEFTHPEGGTFRHHHEALTLPDSWDDKIIAVLGVSTRFRANPHFVKRSENSTSTSQFYPEEIAKLYNFPLGDGTGQTVAIIELGGGYDIDDLNTYMMSRNIPLPNITSVIVGSGKNNTSDVNASTEVCLDIDIIASIVPKAKILVYFAGNNDQDFSNAFAAAINGGATVISDSWGSPESEYSQQTLNAFEQDFALAVSKGINIYAASGDNGSNDGTSSNVVDYPAGSPNVIGTGATQVNSITNNVVTAEVAWGNSSGSSGGGYSKIFSRPSFQSNIGGSTGRGVPDVSADGSPESGYLISVNGTSGVVAGTSSDSPLYSALNILINQSLGKNVGWINPIFYANMATFVDITSGTNGAYNAGPGWDAVCGIGRVDGAKLLQALKNNSVKEGY